jgi:hypothetical protein
VKEDTTNIDFIYTYTESVLKDRDASLRSLNTKCAGLVALSGALFKPFFEINGCSDCDRLKIGVLIALAIAMISGLLGLLASPCGDIADPVVLYDDYREEPTERCKLAVLGTFHKTVEQLTEQGLYKGRCVNTGIVFVVFAISFAFLNGLFSLV